MPSTLTLQRRTRGMPGAVHVGDAGAMINRGRPGRRERPGHRVAIEQVDGGPADRGRPRAAAGVRDGRATTRRTSGSVRREEIQQVAAREPGCAGDERDAVHGATQGRRPPYCSS